MGQNNAKLTDVDLIMAAGIMPTREEIKHSQYGPSDRKSLRAAPKKLKEGLLIKMREKDEAQAIGRFKWTLPKTCKITGEELERQLYYNGQLCLFYEKTLEEFLFARYALDGTIDWYGRFNTIHPLPLQAGVEGDNKTPAAQGKQMAYVSTKKLDVVYMPVESGESGDKVNPDKVCVLVYDHPKQRSEFVIPRAITNDVMLGIETDMLCYMRTNAIMSSGIRGIKVQNANERSEIAEGNIAANTAALNGEPWIPIAGSIEFQELLEKSGAKMADYAQGYQSLDNFRLSTYGLDASGVFEKKAHMLGQEQEANQATSSSVLEQDLKIRQHFCDIVNSIWPDASISVEIAQQQEQESMEGLSGDSMESKEDSNNVKE